MITIQSAELKNCMIQITSQCGGWGGKMSQPSRCATVHFLLQPCLEHAEMYSEHLR